MSNSENSNYADLSKFDQCLKFVKDNFPNEKEVVQYKQAQAVFKVSEVIFKLILPMVVSKALRPSNN